MRYAHFAEICEKCGNKRNMRQSHIHIKLTRLISWRRGQVVSGVRRMNEVNPRRARLVPGWVTVFGRVYHLGMQPTN